MTTLDFELEIGLGAAGSYPVVVRAPGGEAAATLRWSVSPAELDHQLAVVKDKVLVLQDAATRLQVVLEADLPAEAYQALVALDLSAFQQGPVHYDRHQRRWRSELDEWQQGQAMDFRRA